MRDPSPLATSSPSPESSPRRGEGTRPVGVFWVLQRSLGGERGDPLISVSSEFPRSEE